MNTLKRWLKRGRVLWKYRKTLSEAMDSTTPEGLSDNYMLNFHDFSGSVRSIGWEGSDTYPVDSGDSKQSSRSETKKVAVKPIDVLNELERVPTNWSLEDLDGKIAVLKDKRALIKQSYAKREVEALLSCLECRKKYHAKSKNGQPFSDFFKQFDATTGEKIELLLAKYTLVMQSADIFIPEFPPVAVEIMKAYSAVVEELTDKKPLFFVIATEDSFRKTYKKRDPILLAQSPFGFYFYILGAWDKEMVLLSEL